MSLFYPLLQAGLTVANAYSVLGALTLSETVRPINLDGLPKEHKWRADSIQASHVAQRGGGKMMLVDAQLTTEMEDITARHRRNLERLQSKNAWKARWRGPILWGTAMTAALPLIVSVGYHVYHSEQKSLSEIAGAVGKDALILLASHLGGAVLGGIGGILLSGSFAFKHTVSGLLKILPFSRLYQAAMATSANDFGLAVGGAMTRLASTFAISAFAHYNFPTVYDSSDS